MAGDQLGGSALFSDDLVADLKDQWVEVTGPPTDMRDWESSIGAVAAEYSEIRARGAWVSGRADFFGILGLGRAELTHSAMLAWLLDPEGRHGLGRRFLDQLISRYLPGLDPKTLTVRDVECEVQVLETRADIIILGDVATIIIEVKVDAGEGLRQCDRLYERFSDNPDPRFIFLTPSGRPPLTATGEAAKAFVSVSFTQVQEVLELLIDQGSWVDAMRAVVDYVVTLREEFG